MLTTTQPAMARLDMNGAWGQALFASTLQPSDFPAADVVTQAIKWTLRQFGVRGCAGRMAQESGDHPDAAASPDALGAPARPDGGRRTMTGRTVQLSANGRAISAVHPEGSQMTTASTGLAATACQELAAAPRAAVITPADRGHDEAPRPVSQRC